MISNCWKIGDVIIPNRVVLAPMAGVSNMAFRMIAKKFGAGLVVMEMISDKGIQYRNQKTLNMLQVAENEHPLSVQIFGGCQDSLIEAAVFVAENTAADLIDINMGCPVNKVTKAEAGAKWLLSPDKMHKILQAIVREVAKPVTVKMRTGWDSEHVLAIENALAAEESGVMAIAMHGRTREQMYKGRADWKILRNVAEKLKIPFIGNGDVKTPEDARRMIYDVGADAVMIGRAALGNPWILRRIEHFLATGKLIAEPSVSEKIKLAKEHLENLVQLKGEKIGVYEFRQHAAYYLKGVPNSTKIKVAINQLTKKQAVIGLMDDFAKEIAKN